MQKKIVILIYKQELFLFLAIPGFHLPWTECLKIYKKLK